MATTMNKNKVSDMAKDFGLTSKDILSVLSTYEDGSKKPSQVLSADEVNLIFEHLTQKHQVKIESIYAESAPQKKPEPKAAPAPAQNQPKANNAQNQPRNNNNNGGSRPQPQQGQQGKPAQPQQNTQPVQQQLRHLRGGGGLALLDFGQIGGGADATAQTFLTPIEPETGLPDQQPGNVAALHHMNSRTLCRETISFAAAFSPSVMLFSLLILWVTAIFVNQKSVAFAQILVALQFF